VTEDHFDELLGPYLLGELSVEEERELERHLVECPGCRRELDHARQAHDLLRQLATNELPPALKGKLLAQAKSEIPGSSRMLYWASAAAVLLIVAVVGAGLLQTITDDSLSRVPLAATALAPDASGQVRVEEVGENLQVKLEVRGMPELQKNQYYEMWYYAENGERNTAEDDDPNNAEDGGRISCGTFRVGPEGRTTVNLTAPASSRHYPEIEITREPDDGDPGSSGEEVLEGRLRSA
jgi:anti-sigma-K factor RskA